MSLLKALDLPLPSAGAQALPAPPATKPAARKAGKRPPVVYDMEEEVITVPVTRGLPGHSGEVQITDLLQNMRDDVQDYWARYTRGLDSFRDSMSFSSEQEAEPKYLQVGLKSIAKTAFDMAVDAATKDLEPWGAVIGGVKDVVEAWADESERVETAEGEVKIVAYINAVRNGVGARQAQTTAKIMEAAGPLIAQYRALGVNDAAKGKASDDGVIVGEAAGLVNKLAKAAKTFRAKMPSESFFQQAFSRAFADTPGLSDYVSHGAVPTGKIYFGLSLYVDPTENPSHPAWSIKSKDDAWKLVTKAPKPERVAASLSSSLDGKKPWEIGLEKMVKLFIEIEESGLNAYESGWIVFTDSPDSYQLRGGMRHPKWFDAAWKNPMVRSAALDTTKLAGGSDY